MTRFGDIANRAMEKKATPLHRRFGRRGARLTRLAPKEHTLKVAKSILEVQPGRERIECSRFLFERMIALLEEKQ